MDNLKSKVQKFFLNYNNIEKRTEHRTKRSARKEFSTAVDNRVKLIFLLLEQSTSKYKTRELLSDEKKLSGESIIN